MVEVATAAAARAITRRSSARPFRPRQPPPPGPPGPGGKNVLDHCHFVQGGAAGNQYNWPVFKQASDLQGDPIWSSYFKTIYVSLRRGVCDH